MYSQSPLSGSNRISGCRLAATLRGDTFENRSEKCAPYFDNDSTLTVDDTHAFEGSKFWLTDKEWERLKLAISLSVAFHDDRVSDDVEGESMKGNAAAQLRSLASKNPFHALDLEDAHVRTTRNVTRCFQAMREGLILLGNNGRR